MASVAWKSRYCRLLTVYGLMWYFVGQYLLECCQSCSHYFFPIVKALCVPVSFAWGDNLKSEEMLPKCLHPYFSCQEGGITSVL